MIEFHDPYGYGNTYIHLKVPVPDGMPASVEVQGHDLFLKSEFHISLIKTSYVAELIDKKNIEQIEEEICGLFDTFIKKQPLDNYRPTKQFRFVEKDTRKTVIALIEVPHLTKFFDVLRKKLAVNIPDQPTHVTMYTLQPEKGIGILSENQMQEFSQPVKLPEFENLRFVPVAK